MPVGVRKEGKRCGGEDKLSPRVLRLVTCSDLMRREFHMATAEDICSQENHSLWLKPNSEGSWSVGGGGERNSRILREARAGTSRSQCHSGPRGMEEGPCKEGPSGRRINTTFPSICQLLAFLSQFGPVTGCIQQP